MSIFSSVVGGGDEGRRMDEDVWVSKDCGAKPVTRGEKKSTLKGNSLDGMEWFSGE